MKRPEKHLSLLKEYDIDTSDKWGSFMSVFFDLCEYMDYHGMRHLPEWNYRPGAVAASLPDDDRFTPNEYTEEECQELGGFLHRVVNHYDRLGMSY